MISEWKEFRLGDITEWASGGTPSKQNAAFWNGTIPWISASSMGSNRYNESDLKITQEGLKAGSRLAKKDSILLLVRGSTLHQRIPVGIATSDVSFNQDVKAIKAKEEFIDPWYLLFWFMAKEKDLLNMVENTGIGAGKLDTNRLQNLLIRIPPDSERDKILLFAKALDDKLLLNHQINQTLEAMAQAIFKSWFVDFEPVKAKIAAIEAGEDAEGVTRAAMSAISGKTYEELDQLQAEQPEYYTQLKNTAELFPAAMQDSELGEVPEGWEVKPLGKYLVVKRGGSPRPIKDFIVPSGLPWMKIADATAQPSPFLFKTKEFIKTEGLKKTVLLKKGSLILSNSATPGLPKFLELDACIHDGWLHFPEKKLYSDVYLYHLFLELRTKLVAQGNGSVFTNLKTDILRNQVVVAPAREIINKFDDSIVLIFEKLKESCEEINILSQLRDTLLPKLLSGELPVETAEFTEEK